MKTSAWQRFWSWVKGADPRQIEQWIPPFPIAGIVLTNEQALSLSTVWACIDIISKNISHCRWNVYEQQAGQENRRKLLFNDPRFYMLNTRPNPEMTAIALREALFFQAIPNGNAYAEIVKDRGGRVVQLWPLITERMTPRRTPDWELYYEYIQPNGERVAFAPSQIFHLRGPGMYGLMGDNVIARAAKTLALAAAQERSSSAFFGQGAQPIGVLKTAGKLDEATYKRLKEDWSAKYKGPENAYKPLILEAGMEFQAISIDPAKAQMVEDKKFSVEEICRWFGVPPHKVQHLEHATFSNIEHSSIDFVRDSLSPWERRICQEADYKLFDSARAPWKFTEIDLRPLTFGDATSRSNAQASWRQNGIMNTNEIRAMEGLNDIGPDGDVYLVQSNLTTVDRIKNPPEPKPFKPTLPNENEPDELETQLNAIRLRTVCSALESSLNRYSRRMKNRRESLKNKTEGERALSLDSFRDEQATVMLEEMSFFADITLQLMGRVMNVQDMKAAITRFEDGGSSLAFVVSTLPTQAVHKQ